jgi:hypothetical protein
MPYPPARPLIWTPEQDEVLRQGYGKWTLLRLSSAVTALSTNGRTFSEHAVIGRANRLGLKGRPPTAAGRAPRQNTWSDAERTYLRQNYTRLPIAAVIAGLAKIGQKRSKNAIYKAAKDLGMTRPPTTPPQPRPATTWRTPAKASMPEPRAPAAMEFRPGAPAMPQVRPLVDPRDLAPNEADLAHAKVVSAQDRARELLWKGREPSEVASAVRLPMREVFRLVGEVREIRRAGGTL